MTFTSRDTSAPKLRKLETAESLAMLQVQLLDHESSAPVASASYCELPSASPAQDLLSVRVAVRRGRLALLTTVAVVVVVALTLSFRAGVVIDSFERRSVSIQNQEDLLEKYNSYSGTVAAVIERPLELTLTLVVEVVAVRLLADDAIHIDTRWRVGAAATALSAGATFLLANGLSAVNVQAREQPIQLSITADDLSARPPNLALTSTFEKSFSEGQSENPATNTILRNLLIPHATATRPSCYDYGVMDEVDDVIFRMPQYPWMRDLMPTALTSKNLKIAISATNNVDNLAVTPDQFPMNASIAADLLIYSLRDPIGGAAWGTLSSTGEYLHGELIEQVLRSGGHSNASASTMYLPSARLTRLLPPSLATTELQDREWFLAHSGPTMFNISDKTYRNASLRSWNLTLSHVDIEPGVVWVDAITIEREMASPRLQTSTSRDGKTRYFALDYFDAVSAAFHVPIRKAGGSIDDRIDVFRSCVSSDGTEILTSFIDMNDSSRVSFFECSNQSTESLLVLSRGKRLVADALIENVTAHNSTIERGGYGVVVNMREIFSVTIARITWKLQDLATVYKARCDTRGGCMGLDVALTGSHQRLVVGATALPVANVLPLIQSAANTNPHPIVFVRRPQFYNRYKGADGTPFIGDLLLPHNIRNLSVTPQDARSCDTAIKARMAAYINNHVYIERTLQPAYTAAAFFLLQAGVVQDIVNQSWTRATMLAFRGNTQDVDVAVYIPWFNVLLTLVGCVLLTIVVAVVGVWPRVGQQGRVDPLMCIRTPHTIATVLLDQKLFPPLLVTRAVAPSDTVSPSAPDNASEYSIQSLSLQRTAEAASDNDDAEDGSGSLHRPTLRMDP